ncbi:hypothetical protein SLEP1_g30376 [Rubroshorea leprosula]|uniref:Uncharacterized protein n=1 Tax=Rubroshorea leprosula TaxID=152421 RepID=A0AAV5K5S6_9ROSI|nr:hypothetical protein SLEP1_g30376 [Rubroshorea leprosula]
MAVLRPKQHYYPQKEKRLFLVSRSLSSPREPYFTYPPILTSYGDSSSSSHFDGGFLPRTL